jgi:hypothetical protein
MRRGEADMKIVATRDSVSAGDDVDAPHRQEFSFEKEVSVADATREVAKSGYLASIIGGKASWSVVSGIPLAVVAQQWQEPKALTLQPVRSELLDVRAGILHIHFNYHAQIEPESVFHILHGLRLRAF